MAATRSTHQDEEVRIGVRMTVAQFRELNRRAGLGPVDGRARGEYLLGCALGEPHDALLERVQRVRRVAEVERVRIRAEIEAERARDAARRAQGKEPA